MKELEFDVAVVGGGSAGYAAARTAAAAGGRVAILDGAQELGGLCILRGCMPTKALLQAAEVLHQSQRASVWGIRNENVGFDFSALMARKHQLISEFAQYRQAQLADSRFTLIRHHARFRDSHTLDLGPHGTLRAESFVLATGSEVSPPPLESLRSLKCLDSDGALQLQRLPPSLIVLGGGAVAVEFAQFFQRLGVEVTLVQRSGQILKQFDSDAAQVVETVLRREGMRVLTQTKLKQAGRMGSGLFLDFEHRGSGYRVEAEMIFNGLGRHPRIAGLGLEVAGVEVKEGRILCDLHQRTSVPHIFAAGDCAGPHDLVHLAVLQGEVAGANAMSGTPARTMDYRLLTQVLFTEPQVASVGLTEKDAKAQGREYRVARYAFADHGKSLILDATDGFVKLLSHSHTGEILGGACVGPMAGELIHEIIVAMDRRMTARELAAVPHYHPTLAEIWTYPAEELA